MRPIAMLLMIVAVAFPSSSSEGRASSPSPAARPQIPRRHDGHRGGGGLATTGTTAALVSSKIKHALEDTPASASDGEKRGEPKSQVLGTLKKSLKIFFQKNYLCQIYYKKIS